MHVADEFLAEVADMSDRSAERTETQLEEYPEDLERRVGLHETVEYTVTCVSPAIPCTLCCKV